MGFKANSLQVKEDTRKYSKPQTEDLLLNKEHIEDFIEDYYGDELPIIPI